MVIPLRRLPLSPPHRIEHNNNSPLPPKAMTHPRIMEINAVFDSFFLFPFTRRGSFVHLLTDLSAELLH